MTAINPVDLAVTLAAIYGLAVGMPLLLLAWMVWRSL